jgi:hypothetical protein
MTNCWARRGYIHFLLIGEGSQVLSSAFRTRLLMNMAMNEGWLSGYVLDSRQLFRWRLEYIAALQLQSGERMSLAMTTAVTLMELCQGR